MPIDHLLLRIPTTKFIETVAFYTTILAPLGFKKLVETGTLVGFGEEKKPYFLISAKEDEPVGIGLHFAFAAEGKCLNLWTHTLKRC